VVQASSQQNSGDDGGNPPLLDMLKFVLVQPFVVLVLRADADVRAIRSASHAFGQVVGVVDVGDHFSQSFSLRQSERLSGPVPMQSAGVRLKDERIILVSTK
jgi:hypothetical protein